jgi:4-hydroxy-tetrahydrodipicolinate synthase
MSDPSVMKKENTMSRFEGIWIPVVTPFRNGLVDLDATQRLAVDLVDSGVHGLVVCGTTGEAATLDESEQTAMLCAVLEAVGSNFPVAMGIAGSDTREVVRKVARFNQFQTSGYLITPPSYVCPSQQGILLHFQAISAATDRSIILYNIPARTGVNMEQATVMALAADPNFVAIKQCGGNISRIADLLNQTSLKVLCGDDALIFATLCLGGHGAISAAAHIRPDLYVRIFDLVRAGKIEQARATFNALLPLIQHLFSEPNPGPVKAALALQGRIHGELRLPMMAISQTGKDKLAAILERVMALPTWPTLSDNVNFKRRTIHRPRVLQVVPDFDGR